MNSYKNYNNKWIIKLILTKITKILTVLFDGLKTN